MYTVDLNNCLPLTEGGRALLTILSQRDNDEMAREFVEMKTQRR